MKIYKILDKQCVHSNSGKCIARIVKKEVMCGGYVVTHACPYLYDLA